MSRRADKRSAERTGRAPTDGPGREQHQRGESGKPAGDEQQPRPGKPAGDQQQPLRQPAQQRRDEQAPTRAGGRLSLGAQVGLLIAIFAGMVAIAELAGAANLGVALGVGQIAFAIALVFLLVKA